MATTSLKQLCGEQWFSHGFKNFVGNQRRVTYTAECGNNKNDNLHYLVNSNFLFENILYYTGYMWRVLVTSRMYPKISWIDLHQLGQFLPPPLTRELRDERQNFPA